MTELFEKTLSEAAEPLCGVLPRESVVKLYIYMSMLKERSKLVNLTSITDEEDIAVRHFADSLGLCRAVSGEKLRAAHLIDIGTGAGFPGIVLKIVFPGMRLTLLDSLKKRTDFLLEAAEKLMLSDTKVVHGRAEDIAHRSEERERYDIAVSRAVAALPTLCEYSLPFVKPGGVFAAYKTIDASKEIEKAAAAVKILGGGNSETYGYRLPGLEKERMIVLTEKISATPAKYPRRAGLPSSKPL